MDCRLPARKTPQTLPCSSQAPLRPRQTFPAAPTSPWGPGSVLLRTFKAAVCQPAKLAKPSPAAPRRHSGRGRPFLQLQQVPEALAASFYGRSRLATQAAADLSCSSNKSLRPWQCPFKDVQGCRLPARKTRQTLPCSSQAPLRPRQTFPAAPTSPWGRGSVLLRTFKAAPNPPLQLPGATQAAADLSCSSNKSLRPWQCPFKEVQGCCLPALKTPQTLPCSSQAPLRPRHLSCSSNKSLRPWQRLFMDVQGCHLPARKTPQTLPCSSQAPLRPRQTFPAALTSPWGRGSVFLWTFKAAVCQPAKLPKPSPAAPRRHSGRGRPFLQLQQVPEALAVSF